MALTPSIFVLEHLGYRDISPKHVICQENFTNLRRVCLFFLKAQASAIPGNVNLASPNPRDACRNFRNGLNAGKKRGAGYTW
jgi:hypothetical protein